LTSGILIGATCGVVCLRGNKTSSVTHLIGNIGFGGLMSLITGGLYCFAITKDKFTKRRLMHAGLGSIGSGFLYTTYIYFHIGIL
jgi:hypothetical protein